ncbi:MAG: biotin--[acetyl-CoA-carboxylase] ligase, partial [Pseudoclavibacter sp.]
MIGTTRGDEGGRVVFRLAESPSTNDEVRARWAADESGRALPHLSSVTTESQTAGRGRLGREWVPPPGASLAVSTILRLEPEARRWLGWVPLVAGLALRDALIGLLGDAGAGRSAAGRSAAAGGGAAGADASTDARVDASAVTGADAGDRVRVKWPNDVLVDGG